MQDLTPGASFGQPQAKLFPAYFDTQAGLLAVHLATLAAVLHPSHDMDHSACVHKNLPRQTFGKLQTKLPRLLRGAG